MNHTASLEKSGGALPLKHRIQREVTELGTLRWGDFLDYPWGPDVNTLFKMKEGGRVRVREDVIMEAESVM